MDFPTRLPAKSRNSTQMSFQFTSASQLQIKMLFLAVKLPSVAAQVLPQAMDPLSPWHRLHPTTSPLPQQSSWPPPAAQPWSGQPAFETHPQRKCKTSKGNKAASYKESPQPPAAPQHVTPDGWLHRLADSFSSFCIFRLEGQTKSCVTRCSFFPVALTEV